MYRLVFVHESLPALAILHALLPLRASSYWLTKVELLQTLACLDFTSLALVDHKLPAVALNEIVFPLLADTDHRSANRDYFCFNC